MATLIGNLLALMALAVSVGAGVYSIKDGAIVHGTLAYLAWGILWVGSRVTRPPRDLPICRQLTAAEVDAYRSYPMYLMAPGAAEIFSNFLNGLRLAGLAWAVVAFWHGFVWPGSALLSYFFVAGGLILRLAPRHYLGRPAAKGHRVAIEQLKLIDAVRLKRERFYAHHATEAPAKSTREHAANGSRPTTNGTREQADWLFAQVVRTAKAFLSHAERNGLIIQQPSPLLAMIINAELEAFVLGYGLVSTAYRAQAADGTGDVLRVIRVAMAGVFLRQTKNNFRQVAHSISVDVGKTIDDSVPLDVQKLTFALANGRLDAVDDAVALALARIRAGSASPLAPLYDQLVPAFGGPGAPEEYEIRYGPILRDLYASLRQSIRDHIGASSR